MSDNKRCAYCGNWVSGNEASASRAAYRKVVCDDCCQQAEDDERERYLDERDAAAEAFRDEWGAYP